MKNLIYWTKKIFLWGGAVTREPREAISTTWKQEKGQKDPRQEGPRGRTDAKTKQIGVTVTPESGCQTLGVWGKTRALRLSDHP